MTEAGTDLVLIVSLWIEPERLDAYLAFEREAARVMRPHGGVIERVLRIGASVPDAPYEIHIVRFPSREAFAEYQRDPATARLAATRQSVIRRTEILAGFDVSPWA